RPCTTDSDAVLPSPLAANQTKVSPARPSIQGPVRSLPCFAFAQCHSAGAEAMDDGCVSCGLVGSVAPDAAAHPASSEPRPAQRDADITGRGLVRRDKGGRWSVGSPGPGDTRELELLNSTGGTH